MTPSVLDRLEDLADDAVRGGPACRRALIAFIVLVAAAFLGVGLPIAVAAAVVAAIAADHGSRLEAPPTRGGRRHRTVPRGIESPHFRRIPPRRGPAQAETELDLPIPADTSHAVAPTTLLMAQACAETWPA